MHEQQAPPLRESWRVLGILVAIYTCSFIDRSIISLLIQPMRRDLGISDTQISLLQGAAFALFYVVAGFPLGWAADRYSRRILIFVGTALWSFATGLCGLVHSFSALFAARAGVGIGEAALTPAADSLITDLFPRDKLARALGIYTLGNSLGQGLALLIGGTVIALVSGNESVHVPVLGDFRPWQTAFIVIGFPGIFLALLMFTFQEPQRHGRRTDAAGENQMRVRDVVRFVWGHKRAYMFWIFGTAFLSLATFGYSAWMPTNMMRTFHLQPGLVGQIYGVLVLVFGTSGSVIAGIVTDILVTREGKLAYYKVLFWICIFLAISATAAPLVEDQLLAWILIAITLFFANAWTGMSTAALLKVTPNQMRGQAVALRFFFGSVMGFAIAPTLIAMLTDFVFKGDTGVRYSIALVSAVSVPLALVCYRIAKRPYEHMVDMHLTQ